MKIQNAIRLMREVCALRHLSINTEKVLYPLAWPLWLLSQGPKAQSPDSRSKDGGVPDALGFKRRVRFDSKPGLQRLVISLP